MQLTQDQATAMQALQRFMASGDEQVFILTGYAGTGKTFVIRQLVELLLTLKIMPQVMAPTGRAAKVLNTGLPDSVRATTIHKAIYELTAMEGEEGKLQFAVRQPDGVRMVIVDEASMVSSKAAKHELVEFGSGVLIDDLLSYVRPWHGGKVIFVGDPAQLPPVGDNSSAALDEQFFIGKGLRVSSCCLTTIVRQQAESQILKAATTLRALLDSPQRNTLVIERKEGEVIDLASSAVAQQFVADQQAGRTTAVVCFSNQQALSHNNAIRSLLSEDDALIRPGERLMVVRNNYSRGTILLNGDIITICEASDETIMQSAPVTTEETGVKVRKIISLQFKRVKFTTDVGKELQAYVIVSLLNSGSATLSVDEARALYINLKMRAQDRGIDPKRDSEAFRDFMVSDEFYNALLVKYGYAFTCHKAQGSEWESAIVDFTRRTGLDSDSLRWKYTAVTRAKQRLYCVGLHDIQPMDGIRILPIAQASRVLPRKVEYECTLCSPFHGAGASALASKYWSVSENMQEDGGAYTVENVGSFPYRERYCVKTPSGHFVKVDCHYAGCGLFTKYDADDGDEKLLSFFKDESNMAYHISYSPECESLAMLRSKMESLCQELNITLLSIEPKSWQVAYFMRTSQSYSAVKFNFNKAGKITFAEPRSEKGSEDEQLKQLIDKLTDKE